MTFPAWGMGLIGMLIGSFLNVCIDRLPDQESILTPPSHCPHCQRRLTPLELIPILSYLVLRGRCRTCGKPIPIRSLLVELGTGLAFLLIWDKFGSSWFAGLNLVYASFLILMAVIDLERGRILNVLSYPAIGLGLIAIPLFHLDQPFSHLLGGLIGFGVLFLIAVLSPGAMGMGDVKLVIFLGLITGTPEVILVLFLSFVIGGLIAGILLLLKVVGRKDSIAFGPYLALAGLITLLYGEEILQFWLRRTGL